MNKLRILIIEDDSDAADGLTRLAKSAGFDEVETAESPAAAKRHWNTGDGFDAVTLDLQMENDKEAGFRLLQELRSGAHKPRRVFIYSATLDSRIKSLQAVGSDTITFHLKPNEKELLGEQMEAFVQAQTAKLRAKIYSGSPGWKELMRSVEHLAKSELPVLLLGPTGGGKTTFAKHLAQESGCPPDRTKVINCASLGENLVESELFGYCKGAFTGALKDTVGSLLVASGFKSLSGEGGRLNKGLGAYKSIEPKWGAVILDEVAALPLHLQAKLLTVLDGTPMCPISHTGPGFLPNFRVFATTNEIKKFSDPDQFRTDLRHRLQGWVIQVPDASVQTNVVAQILEDEGVFFRNELGERDKMKIVWGAEAKEFLLSEACLSKIEGGFREIKNIIARATLYALLAGAKVVSKEMVEKALQQNIQPVVSSPMAGSKANEISFENEASFKITEWLTTNAISASALNYEALLATIPDNKIGEFLLFWSTKITGTQLEDGFYAIMNKGLKPIKRSSIRSAFSIRLKAHKRRLGK